MCLWESVFTKKQLMINQLQKYTFFFSYTEYFLYPPIHLLIAKMGALVTRAKLTV